MPTWYSHVVPQLKSNRMEVGLGERVGEIMRLLTLWRWGLKDPEG